MKEANKDMKILLVIFSEKISFGVIWSFLAFMPFFIAWLGIVKLSRPLLIGSFNGQDMISFMITTGSLNSQDKIRILKQWRHDFSGKYLCDR